MTDIISTNQLFSDLVDYIERKCEEQGIENLLDIVEKTVKMQFINIEVDEADLNVFMYQLAFAVSMRYKAKAFLQPKGGVF